MNLRQLTAAGLLMLALPLSALPQDSGHNGVVTWAVTATAQPSSTGERVYRVEIAGRIAPGYIIYGSDFDAEIGPRPARLRLDAPAKTAAGATLKSLGTQRRTDKVFKTEYTYFENQAQLSQLIVAAPGASSISGRIVGQTCYEADGTCALFNERFEVSLPDPQR